MKKIFLLSFLLLCGQFVFSQPAFHKLFNTNAFLTFKSLKQTIDNGYIMAGGIVDNGNPTDAFVIKVDSLGDTLWTRHYGVATDFCIANSITQGMDGNYYIGGYKGGVGSFNYDFYLVKINSNGDTLWSRTIGKVSPDYCYDVESTHDSGFVAFGVTGGFEADFFLNKWSKTGTLLWSKSYSIPQNNDQGYSVKETADHGFIMTGETEDDLTTDKDIYLVKADSNGTAQWGAKFGGAEDDFGYSVQQTSDGGYVIAGTTENVTSGISGMIVIKTNAGGIPLWSMVYSKPNGYYNGNSIYQTADGGYMLSGWGADSIANDLSYNIEILKIDTVGNIVWTKSFGTSDDEQANEGVLTKDGGFAACGRLISQTFLNPAFVFKTDATGSQACYTENNSMVAYPFTGSPNGAAAYELSNIGTIAYPSTEVKGGLLVSSLCNPVGINNVQSVSALKVYPNPFIDDIIISADLGGSQIGLIILKNTLGQVVSTKRITQNEKVDLSYLKKGIYFIEATFDNVKLLSKVVKMD